MGAKEVMSIKAIKDVITVVTATPALRQSLQQTLDAVKREILSEAATLLPEDRVRALGEILKTGARDKIASHLREENYVTEDTSKIQPVAYLPDDPVIFRVKGAIAFSQPLQETLEAVKKAIIYASCIRHRCDETAVRTQLKARYERVHSHFATAKQELQQAGWPIKH
jgi:hypothetical protein